VVGVVLALGRIAHRGVVGRDRVGWDAVGGEVVDERVVRVLALVDEVASSRPEG
jgi:hypothetical protein